MEFGGQLGARGQRARPCLADPAPSLRLRHPLPGALPLPVHQPQTDAGQALETKSWFGVLSLGHDSNPLRNVIRSTADVRRMVFMDAPRAAPVDAALPATAGSGLYYRVPLSTPSTASTPSTLGTASNVSTHPTVCTHSVTQ